MSIINKALVKEIAEDVVGYDSANGVDASDRIGNLVVLYLQNSFVLSHANLTKTEKRDFLTILSAYRKFTND